mmetsp:Transcript_2992/g.7255  ORF Transcript_2992/g.7255 Transcript_2992/m.7255 type:complete len:354 (-) Transcript_2992:409-1470(-)
MLPGQQSPQRQWQGRIFRRVVRTALRGLFENLLQHAAEGLGGESSGGFALSCLLSQHVRETSHDCRPSARNNINTNRNCNSSNSSNSNSNSSSKPLQGHVLLHLSISHRPEPVPEPAAKSTILGRAASKNALGDVLGPARTLLGSREAWLTEYHSSLPAVLAGLALLGTRDGRDDGGGGQAARSPATHLQKRDELRKSLWQVNLLIPKSPGHSPLAGYANSLHRGIGRAPGSREAAGGSKTAQTERQARRKSGRGTPRRPAGSGCRSAAGRSARPLMLGASLVAGLDERGAARGLLHRRGAGRRPTPRARGHEPLSPQVHHLEGLRDAPEGEEPGLLSCAALNSAPPQGSSFL